MSAPTGARARRPARSALLPPRTLAVCAATAAVGAAVAVLAMTTGEFPLAPVDVVRSLLGAGEPGTDFVVLQLRLPRVLVAVGVGVALAVSGALFQALTRNPLGSPDVVGFTMGASAGAVAALVLGGATGWGVPASAVLGGTATAAAVYALAWRAGHGTAGYRLVLVGVAVQALATAVVSWLLVRGQVQDAQQAVVWLTGSLNGRSWEQVVPLAVALAVLLPCAALLVRPLGMLALGDDAAVGLGVRVQRTQLLVGAVGVVLAALAVAAAGPVAFVALAAPQVAARLVRSPGPQLLASALVGATLLLAADWLAQRVLAPAQVPVGVVTGLLGGAYLAWLLSREWRWRAA
ncbi:iron chelate uptake ABC transporter family permease subunit [Quadrisphaera sp. DSM 44207]|uniref:FecCD family ABC transporter permease n=1 Tax=Quadrisphaera sp. DSM 44207 TaxID=1881057 RepID=UPI0008829F18|nr:iron chelate uptake ABC transporter family permease subunit [Quadrisphaera sp. DSM 44207]SDQ87062.1 iron complex transport system permease protein [Quadrisphaera sp. DSM 44207]